MVEHVVLKIPKVMVITLPAITDQGPFGGMKVAGMHTNQLVLQPETKGTVVGVNNGTLLVEFDGLPGVILRVRLDEVAYMGPVVDVFEESAVEA
ncbi:hypothetical protein [Anaeroselena agilis]|uniref:Uncharacterized protein n=1 Tax=Anaeroselena agilis TaxID=3063788 RepID=A0ABU3NZI2_9FIRM|nr:hypothetical protein [Selenomonadales bacterium 4137-cl]